MKGKSNRKSYGKVSDVHIVNRGGSSKFSDPCDGNFRMLIIQLEKCYRKT